MEYIIVNNNIIDTTTHITGHVFIITKHNEVILGHNKYFDYIASFGGYKDHNETLLDTILREWNEETHECIINSEQLVKYINKSKIIMNHTEKGDHYTCFCKIDDMEFDINIINKYFTQAISQPILKEDQLENDYMVMISLDDIMMSLSKGDDKVKNHFGKYEKIRKTNISYYKIYEALTQN